MTESVLAQLSMLPNMDTSELEAMWHNLFEEPPASTNKTHLIRKIAWRIQEMAYGGLSEDTQSKIQKLQKNPEHGSKRKKGMPPVGTQLIREHGGLQHRVMVLEDGFEYQSCKYKSLSEIARLITGTRWSGPKFFGLKA